MSKRANSTDLVAWELLSRDRQIQLRNVNSYHVDLLAPTVFAADDDQAIPPLVPTARHQP